MCLRSDCGLCGICMRGFKLEENVGSSPTRRSRTRWLMYGRGIYFSSVSGKANDFSTPTAKVKRWLSVVCLDHPPHKMYTFQLV